jgi:hypothetical protein
MAHGNKKDAGLKIAGIPPVYSALNFFITSVLRYSGCPEYLNFATLLEDSLPIFMS